MTAEGQLGIGSLLERGLAKLLETGDLGLREVLVGDVVERRPTPETEAVVKCRRRSLWIARGEQLSPALEESLEPLRVELLGILLST